MIQNSINLRPMRLVELLDAAFRLYRRNFWTFIGIMALVQIPISLLTWGASILTTQGTLGYDTVSSFPNAFYWIGLAGTLIVSILAFFLVSGLATAALSRSVASSSFGNPISILESYKKIGPTLGNLLLSLLLAGLLQLGFLIWTVIPCIGWVSGLGMLLYMAFVIIELIVPVVVLEKRGPGEALRRTWELARQRFWWFLGLAGVLYLLNWVLVGPSLLITFGLGSAFTRTGVGNMAPATLAMINASIQSLTTMLVSILYYPLRMSVIILAYFDLRVRYEGLDLSMQSLDTNAYPDPVDGIAAAPAAPQTKSLITGMEFGYFVAVSLGGALLLVVLYGALFSVLFGAMGIFGRGF